MPRNRAWIMLAAATALPCLALAQPDHRPPAGDSAPARDISPLLAPIRDSHKLPALAAVVLHDETIVAQGVVGIRRQGSDEPATLADQWHIGSCTKSMTATLIALLVQEGKLSWTSTVSDSFPEFAAAMDPAWKPVTIEQLLTHRAGAPASLDAGGLWGRLWAHTGTPTEQRLTLVEGVTSRPPVSTPGTEFLYANAGFAIAGAMAEKATGRAWEDLMRSMIFEPLGMSSAGFGPPGTAKSLDQPRGHRPSPDGPQPVEPGRPGADNPASIGPGGTVHCSLPDWARYIALHLHGARGERVALPLPPESFTRLHAPAGPDAKPDDGYAMGWGVARREWGGRVLTHNGSNTMWFAVVWIAPEKDFAVLIATNIGGDDAAKAADEAAWAVIQDHLAHAGSPAK